MGKSKDSVQTDITEILMMNLFSGVCNSKPIKELKGKEYNEVYSFVSKVLNEYDITKK